MSLLDDELDDLRQRFPKAFAKPLPSGAFLIEIPEFDMPAGWSVSSATLLFLAPPGFPAARPDCFWIEPVGLRLANGATPQNTNDANPIPEEGARGTWFSWHLQNWDPNHDGLQRYVRAIGQRLDPAR